MTAFLDDWWRGSAISEISPVNAAIALLLAALAYLLMTRTLTLMVRRLAGGVLQTRTRADDALMELLGRTHRGLIALAAGLIGLSVLDLPDRWADRVDTLWFIAVAMQLALWATQAVNIYFERQVDQRRAAPSPRVSAATTLMSWGARTLIWTIVLLAMMSNLGINITAFIASLGVGGVAIALAAQSILGDLFASMAIAIDKPFELGDFVVVGGVAGTVEYVGVKTTRIRSLGGEQVVMSNTELLKQTLSNYKRLQERRIVFGFRVAYDTDPDVAAALPGLVERVVSASHRLRFDRAHLKALGDSSLEYEVVYIVLDADFNAYMDEQQRINLGLLREFSGLGVRFAFPTRTVSLLAPGDVDIKPSDAG